MSWEDDVLATVRDLIHRSKEVVTYAGTVSNIDTVNKVVSVIVDGAQASTPCLPLAHIDLSTGNRVTVMKAGGTYYVVGVMAFKSVVRAPGYSGTHPIGTQPGDMWYRSDLNHFYGNVNGTPTQLDN